MSAREDFDGIATNLFGKQLESMNWIIKFPIKNMKQLCNFSLEKDLKSNKGIRQEKLEQTLRKKLNSL